MKAKKIIALILVAIFSLGIVAACGADDPPPPPPDPGTNGATGDDVDIPTPDDLEQLPEAEVRVFENHVVITYSCPQVVQGLNYNTDCEYAMHILEKFNFTFEGINVGWGDWNETHAMWIMAQDMPDVIVFNYGSGTHADAANYVDQGLIRRLPDDWKSRWPNLAMVHMQTSLGPMLDEFYGGTYFLPRARFFFSDLGNPLSDHWSLRLRNDWLNELGIEPQLQYTIPEVLDIARRIRDEDPGDMGVNLIPLALRPSNAARFFLTSNSTWWNSFFIDDDGLYQWGPFCPAFEEGLILWYEAFDEGLLGPEFFLFDHNEDVDLFMQTGRVGIIFDGAPTASWGHIYSDFRDFLGLTDEALGIANLLGVNGLYHQRDLINFWGAVAFSPTADQEVVERWLYLMDFMATRDGYPGTQMGIRGVDWDWENGTLVSFVPPDVRLPGTDGKYPSLGHVLGSSILWDDLGFDNPNIPLVYREMSRELYRLKLETSDRESFPYVNWELWMFDSHEFRMANGINITDDMTRLVVEATSVDNLLTIFHAWRDAQMGIIQPALDQLNANR